MPTLSQVRLGWVALAAVATLGAVAVAPASAEPAAKFEPVLVAESKSKSLCEADPGRIFVKYQLGSECIAYYITPGLENVSRAVMFMDGDASLKDFGDEDKRAASLEAKKRFLNSWSVKMKVRYVYISRVGLNGSSGNHALRRKPNETMVMDAAIDILQQKFGLTTIAIAGQSGGSTIAASLLTRGREGVACAVLGSGAYELAALEYDILTSKGRNVTKEAIAKAVYDPSKHVDGIRQDANRRIFILGDADDQRTPIDQQIRFHNDVEAAGHHVRFALIKAKGELDHGAMHSTIPAAGACLNGMSDERIVAAVKPKGVQVSKSDR